MTEGRERQALPFGLKLLICFLVVEAIEQVVTLGLSGAVLYRRDTALGTAFWSERVIQPVMLLCFCGLLAGLLAMRSGVGRIWAIIFFLANSAIIVFTYTYQIPDLWPSLSLFERVRTVATVGIELAFSVYLFSDGAREVLVE